MLMLRLLPALAIATCCVALSQPAAAATKTAMMHISIEVRPSCGAATRSDPGTAVAFTCGAESNSVPLRREMVQDLPVTIVAQPVGKQNKHGATVTPNVMLTEF